MRKIYLFSFVVIVSSLTLFSHTQAEDAAKAANSKPTTVDTVRHEETTIKQTLPLKTDNTQKTAATPQPKAETTPPAPATSQPTAATAKETPEAAPKISPPTVEEAAKQAEAAVQKVAESAEQAQAAVQKVAESAEQANTKQVIEPAPTPEPETVNPLADKNALQLIIIGSQSMNDNLGTNKKIDTMQAAIKNALRFIPNDTHSALRVSGHRLSADNAEASCQDSELLLGAAPGQEDKIESKLQALKTQGKRSIVKTITQGLADLAPYGGTKTLIVIVDGTEECLEQDPIAYLAPESLKKHGYTIHIRSLGMATEQQPALKALAEATDGSYANADDGFTFTQQIAIAVKQGANPQVKVDTPALQVGEEKPNTPPSVATDETTETAEKSTDSPAPGEVKPVKDAAPTPVAPAFDEKIFTQKVLKEIKATMARSFQQQNKTAVKTKVTPQQAPKDFSVLSLTIIAIESLLLILALTAIVLLLLKQRRE